MKRIQSKLIRTPFLMVVLSTVLSAHSFAGGGTGDEKKIEKAVKEFVATADAQDADKMATILDPNFSSLVNRLFGAETTSVTSKEDYVALLREKKIGGDSRKVEILSIDVQGENASVKAIFDGTKLKFTSYLLLAKDKEGVWRVVTDYPAIEVKS